MVDEIFAYYLPQYYPVPLNDEWWGEGYTEWNALVKAHRGLRAPAWSRRTPGELGFYDLRLKETRRRQGELARAHNISAFAIYHYYSDGRRPMSDVFERIRTDGEPDIPFFICWANHDWTLGWAGRPDVLTFEQSYTEHVDDTHFKWMLDVFSDSRYYRIDGRPVVALFRPSDVPCFRDVFARWRGLATENGFPGLVILGVNQDGDPRAPERLGLDAWIESPGAAIRDLRLRERLRVTRLSPKSLMRLLRYGDYEITSKGFLQVLLRQRERATGAVVPTVFAGWNNVGRRPRRAWYLRMDECFFAAQLRAALASAPSIAGSDVRLVCLNAWNEWGEMMTLEPTVEAGRSLLETLLEESTASAPRQEGNSS